MIRYFEKNIAPYLIKLSNNKVLIAVRDGLSLTIPFTIIGSIFLILGNLPIPIWSKFIAPYSPMLDSVVNVTFNILGLISTIGISYYLGKQYNVNQLSNVLITVVAFFLVTLNEEFSIEAENFGADGMFTGIVISLFTTFIHKFFIDKKITIRMPEGVPPAVSNSFISLLPAAVIIFLMWIFRVLCDIELIFHSFQNNTAKTLI